MIRKTSWNARRDAAKRKFSPKFFNRLDKAVVYRSLGEEQLRQILDLELDQVRERILRSYSDRPFFLIIDEDGKAFLLRQGVDVYGARHLKRAIERLLVQPLANVLASGQVRVGDYVLIEACNDELKFRRRTRLDEAA